MEDYLWLARSFTWDLWLPVGLVGHPAGAGSGWGKQSPLSQILVPRCSRVSSCSLQGRAKWVAHTFWKLAAATRTEDGVARRKTT